MRFSAVFALGALSTSGVIAAPLLGLGSSSSTKVAANAAADVDLGSALNLVNDLLKTVTGTIDTAVGGIEKTLSDLSSGDIAVVNASVAVNADLDDIVSSVATAAEKIVALGLGTVSDVTDDALDTVEATLKTLQTALDGLTGNLKVVANSAVTQTGGQANTLYTQVQSIVADVNKIVGSLTSLNLSANGSVGLSVQGLLTSISQTVDDALNLVTGILKSLGLDDLLDGLLDGLKA